MGYEIIIETYLEFWFLLQVLGKSAKPIPVMVLGILLARKRYPAVKFLFITMICIGVSLFLYKDQEKKTVIEDKPIFGFGEILLVCIDIIVIFIALYKRGHQIIISQQKRYGYSLEVPGWGYSLEVPGISNTMYCKTSNVSVSMAYLLWLIQTCFWVPRKFFWYLKKTNI